jgi:thioredoxin reductase (NADPH)
MQCNGPASWLKKCEWKALLKSNMEEAQPAQVSKVRIYGTMGSAVGYMIRDFLHRSDIPYEWIELTTEESARKLAGLDSIHDSRLPVCLFPDGTRMECPLSGRLSKS